MASLTLILKYSESELSYCHCLNSLHDNLFQGTFPRIIYYANDVGFKCINSYIKSILIFHDKGDPVIGNFSKVDNFNYTTTHLKSTIMVIRQVSL